MEVFRSDFLRDSSLSLWFRLVFCGVELSLAGSLESLVFGWRQSFVLLALNRGDGFVEVLGDLKLIKQAGHQISGWGERNRCPTPALHPPQSLADRYKRNRSHPDKDPRPGFF